MARKIDRKTLLTEAANRIDPYDAEGWPHAPTDLEDLTNRQVRHLLLRLADREEE